MAVGARITPEKHFQVLTKSSSSSSANIIQIQSVAQKSEMLVKTISVGVLLEDFDNKTCVRYVY